MRPGWLVSVCAVLATLLALVTTGSARADDGASESGDMPPRDVGVVVQPGTASLGELPSDFERIEAGWLTFEFPGSVRSRVVPLANEAEAVRGQLSEDLGQPVLDQVLVRVARDPAQMADLAPRGQPPPAYAAGVAYASMHLLLLSLQAPDSWEAPDLSEVFRHELSHLALADAAQSHHVPGWFDEGLAVQQSGELRWKRLRTLWDASLSRRLIPLDALDGAFPKDGPEVSIAYAESADIVRFLMRDGDRARFGSLIQRVRSGVAFDRALEDAYGTNVRTLEYQWRDDVEHRLGWVPALTGGGLVWILIVGLAVAAWVTRTRRAKAKLAQWALEEARANAAPPLVAVTAGAVGPPSDEPMPARIPSVPVVEHEGRWYTLH